MQQFFNWVEKIQTILLNDLNMYFHVFEQMFKRLEIDHGQLIETF